MLVWLSFDQIRSALALPETGNTTLQNHDAISSAATGSTFEDAYASMAIIVALAKIHTFILETAVMIVGKWT